MSERSPNGSASSQPMEGYSAYRTVAVFRTDDGILLVRLHNPDGGPLEFSMDAHAEWVSLWQEIAQDRRTRLVIITGTGDTFMAQRKALPGGAKRASVMTPLYWQRIMRESTDHVLKMLEIPVPVIAAVNGPAPVHAELALLADIVIATPDTVFRDASHLPEQVIPTDLQHVLIPALIGRIRSSYFFLTDQRIGADEAKRLGMINEIIPRDLLLARALQIARFIGRQPDFNLRYYRRILTHELRGKLHGLLEYGLAVEGLAAMSADWENWVVDNNGLPDLEHSSLTPIGADGLEQRD
jgi:enoyl-CoA hydratase/carnithine racemase